MLLHVDKETLIVYWISIKFLKVAAHSHCDRTRDYLICLLIYLRGLWGLKELRTLLKLLRWNFKRIDNIERKENSVFSSAMMIIKHQCHIFKWRKTIDAFTFTTKLNNSAYNSSPTKQYNLCSSRAIIICQKSPHLRIKRKSFPEIFQSSLYAVGLQTMYRIMFWIFFLFLGFTVCQRPCAGPFLIYFPLFQCAAHHVQDQHEHEDAVEFIDGGNSDHIDHSAGMSGKIRVKTKFHWLVDSVTVDFF